MKYLATKILLILCAFSLLSAGLTYSLNQQSGKWVSLFDGTTLDGWKAAENPDTFSVTDGKIVVHGPRAHLFYTGSVSDHNFSNFEFKADIMTTEGSNSGIFFHTEYQESGWPSKGPEVQVNNTYQKDPRKTASLYGIDDVRQAPVKDNEWFTMYIKVEGKHVIVKVDGETMVDYTEPDDTDGQGKIRSGGTFALQGHDPDSKVYYKNIKVRPL